MMTRRARAIALATTLFAALPHSVLAGPPLLCFPFEIGSAKTLPMAGVGWHAIDPAYDVARWLADDTLALLSADVPIVVRMETIRRAALYAAPRPSIAVILLEKLEARTRAGRDILALFDYGYAIETLRQAETVFRTSSMSAARPDGYRLVLEALRQRPDPAIEFAAAVMTQERPNAADHRGHLERAAAGASLDSALAVNLHTHFSQR